MTTAAIIGSNLAFSNDAGYGQARHYTNIDGTWDGDTLTSDFDDYFVTIPFDPYSLNLPDPTTMGGRTITFTVVSEADEGSVTLNGTFGGGESYTIPGSEYNTTTLISDGTQWWIFATFNPGFG